jgi:hypothetical protein
MFVNGPSYFGRTDYVRHRTALAGLSGGSPLIDLDIARFMLRVPPELSFDPTLDRPFARGALRGILPEKVRQRTLKSNLFAYYRDVLAGPDLRWLRKLLSDPSCEIYAYVERSHIEPLLGEIPPADDEAALVLGALHTAALIECWLRQQDDPDAIVLLLEQQDAADRAGA